MSDDKLLNKERDVGRRISFYIKTELNHGRRATFGSALSLLTKQLCENARKLIIYYL